jgi:DNA polymerase (family 10)
MSGSERAARAARLAKLLGLGAAGRALAARLAAEGVRGRRGLLGRLEELPREARAAVRHRPLRRIKKEEAAAQSAELARRLRFGRPPRRAEVTPVGSVRRGEPESGDLDFLVVAPRPPPEFLAGASLAPPRRGESLELAEAYAGGPRRRGLIVRGRWGGRARAYRVDLFLAKPAERPFALFHFTGPAGYNVRVRAHAKRRGLRLNQYGLFEGATARRARGAGALRSEAALARRLGLTPRPPGARR